MTVNSSKVSIIVPVYNAENTISRCVESIISQDYENIEIFLVDDGSKDSSFSIMKGYADVDSRICLIHKENSGVSDTRNLAISKANGEYIQFLDADDYIPTDSTKSLVRAIESTNADLVVADFYRVSGNHLARKGSVYSASPLTRNEYAEIMSDSPADFYYGVLWNKLYRKSIINEFELRMDEGLSFCEDTIFNLEYLLHCKTVYPLQIPVYYYVKTEGSLVTQNTSLSKIYNMKTNVFRYYNSFFKEILNEKEYRNERLQISKFLILPAMDNIVFPFSPNTKTVGEEHGAVYFDQSGIPNLTTLNYYLQRSYDRYLSTVAAKNNLELNDIKVFDFIRRFDHVQLEKDFLETTGLTIGSMLVSLQKLSSRNLITFKISGNMSLSALVTEKSNSLKNDIDLANHDLYSICTKDMSEDEIEQTENLLKLFNRNLQQFLKNAIVH